MNDPSTQNHSLQWGDRVDHKKFGFGTVCGEPEGDKVLVEWDDPQRKTTGVMASFLQLVTRPDAKGGAYWNNEYKKLLEAVKVARVRSDTALANAFRPTKGSGIASIDQALSEEKSPMDALREFLEEDEKGNHP